MHNTHSQRKRALLVFTLFLIPCYSMASTLDFAMHREMDYVLSLIIAFILGVISGLTHSTQRKAGVSVAAKTYGAVSLGSALFTCICLHVSQNFHIGNTLQNLGSIISGIGFLCAAVIFKEGSYLRGLSTSASLWTTASVGIACGIELYTLAVAATMILALFHLLPSSHAQMRFDSIDLKNQKKDKQPDNKP